ncbi:flagellar biosynthesis protein FlhF [Polynucleobacter corsicus]|uniref:flagellar biosynthesis protein FlhF n=1 Tax=Polynucleobacter corsicus TaxID=2081042 RepID=UPI001BFD7AAF|nr:flagellar biosynthesis protein FlhF [Polynucleobacter corsicus]QWE19302.1 flagellar biosynthesis protein FlhF [Polynucleobacter corsicus]
MGPQKFTAANSADALKMVREKMGSDALVLATRDVPEGVEIVAISPDALAQLATQRPHPASPITNTAATIEEVPVVAVPTPSFNSIASSIANPPAPTSGSNPDVGGLVIADVIQTEPRANVVDHQLGVNPSTEQTPRVEKLIAEVEEVKKMLQSHLAGNYWGNLQQQSASAAEVTKALLSAGFSPKLCTQLMQDLDGCNSVTSLLGMVQKKLEQMIHTIDPIAAFDQGGVFAFIGPTGVGKTTTVAKVAARCVLRYGRNQVALLSTDTYRIGAQEQLKVFARILGLPVISLRDSEDLASKLQELSQRRIILLDTAGVNQRDVLMIEQSQLLKEGSRHAHRILVMSSTTDLRTQEDVITLHNQASKEANQTGILGAIITKTDEAAQIAPVLDSLIRHELPLMFLSNGQRVPEDLSQANVPYLAHRAMRPRQLSSNLSVQDEQVPALMADYLNDWTKNNFS